MIDIFELTEFHNKPAVFTDNSLKSLGLRGKPKKIIEKKIYSNNRYQNKKKVIEFTKEGLASEKKIFEDYNSLSNRISYKYDTHQNITSLKHDVTSLKEKFSFDNSFHIKWDHQYDSRDRLIKVKMLQKSGVKSDSEFGHVKIIEFNYFFRKSDPYKISFYNCRNPKKIPKLKKEITIERDEYGKMNKKSIREFSDEDSNKPITEYTIKFIYDHYGNLILKLINVDNILEKSTYNNGRLYETTKYELKTDLNDNLYTEKSEGIRFDNIYDDSFESKSNHKEVFLYEKKVSLIDGPSRYYLSKRTLEDNWYIYEDYNDRTQIQFKNLFHDKAFGTIIHLLHDKFVKYKVSKKSLNPRTKNLGHMAKSANLVRYETDEIGNWLKKSHFSGEMTFDNEVPLESNMNLDKEEKREIQYYKTREQ